MSLKHFHIFFIAVCLALMVFLTAWFWRQGGTAAAALCAGSFLLGSGYLTKFLTAFKGIR